MADIDPHWFPQVDYIELQYVLNAETLYRSSYARVHAGKSTLLGNTVVIRSIPGNSHLVELKISKLDDLHHFTRIIVDGLNN